MAQDLYRFFRIEARELIDGLGQDILALEKGAPAREPVGRMLRLAHTLKGAARVVRQTEIADLAHRVEDLLVPFRDADAAIPRECCDAFQSAVEAMAARLRALDAVPPQAPPATPPATPPTALSATAPATAAPAPTPTPHPAAPHPAAAPPEEPLRTLRIDLDALDDILGGTAQAAVSLEALSRGIATIEESVTLADSLVTALAPTPAPPRDGDLGRAGAPARARALAERLRAVLGQLRGTLGAAVERTSRDLDRTGDAVRRLRLVPAGTIFPALERTAQDTAEQLGKSVRFETTGGDVLLDAHGLGGLRDALVQIVRNAVAHGLESAADRLRAGKPAEGLIVLRVERRGHRVVFQCRDDGRGLDLAAVRAAILRRGLMAPDKVAAITLDEAVALVFRGGLSTARTVTAFSGRGVGLELVREVLARLKGELTAETEAGRGTAVAIGVPVSLASMTVLQVAAGGTVVSIPLEAVRQAVRTADSTTAPSVLGDALLFDGGAIPFLHLPALLRAAPRPALPTPASSAVSAGR